MHHTKKLLCIALNSIIFLTASIAFAAKAPVQSGPFDIAIADEQKLIAMLKESGKIPHDAGFAEAQAQLRQYLQNRQTASLLAAQNASQTQLDHVKHRTNILKLQKPGANRFRAGPRG